MAQLEKPVALITGGARGIGAAITQEIAKTHRVAFSYFEGASEAQALADHLKGAKAYRANLAEAGAAQALVAHVIADFGRIDALVNNAAMVEEQPWDHLADGNFLKTLAVNTSAPAMMIAAALPHLETAKGCVVNITSLNATFPPLAAPAYGASKAALENLTKAAARALGPRGIRVNAVSPGFIERAEKPRDAKMHAYINENTALGRSGTPEEIADAVQFLSSDKASYITGAILPVSGGHKL